MNKKLVNNINRSPTANSLALHDFATTTYDLKGWTEYVVAIFRKYGLEPIRMAISPATEKMLTYAREVKKLDKLDISTITGISIKATLNGSDNCHGDQIFTAIFDIGLNPEITTCLLTLDNAIVPLECDIWNNIAKDMSVFFKPRYGYVYKRPYKIGPEWYAFGISCDLKHENPERKLISCWSKAYRNINGKYKIGDMRDVYPLNILSKAHNERKVDGLSLFDWINKSQDHGTLIKLSDNLWSWWIEENNIEMVRAALKPTGILLCAP